MLAGFVRDQVVSAHEALSFCKAGDHFSSCSWLRAVIKSLTLLWLISSEAVCLHPAWGILAAVEEPHPHPLLRTQEQLGQG